MRRRHNPTALQVAREDDLGRVALPMMAAGVGAAAGILLAKPIGKSPTAAGLVGAVAGLIILSTANLIDKARP